jgi:hypothetical protein
MLFVLNNQPGNNNFFSMNNRHYPQHDWKKYLIVFLITLGIFLVAIYLSSSLSNKRFAEMRTFQDKLATDILSSETRFALLERTSCEHFVDDDALLSEELNLFGERLARMRRQLSANDPEVEQLSRYYSLLQVKDYLLVTQLAEKCATAPTVMLYFTKEDCAACERQQYIIDDVHKDYTDLSLYSFDYDTELSAVRTLISTLDVDEEDLPVIILNDEVYNGGLTEDELREKVGVFFPEEIEDDMSNDASEE